MKKILLVLMFLFVVISVNAQKIKVKKGNILVDKVKFGTIEKLKNKELGRHAIVKDNNGKEVFKALLLNEKSKIYDKKLMSYFVILCNDDKDTIGVSDTFFYVGEKKVAKYLVKNNLLNKDGVNKDALTKHLTEKGTKNRFVVEFIENEKELIKNANFKADRDKTKPIVIENTNETFRLSVRPKNTRTQNIYKITQGDVHIGYALTEISHTQIEQIIICNTKKSPVGYFNNFDQVALYPFKEIDEGVRDRMDVSKPFESIKKFTRKLIDLDKI